MSASVNWRDDAACARADPDLFFPVSATGLALSQIDEATPTKSGAPCASGCPTVSGKADPCRHQGLHWFDARPGIGR